MKVLIVEDGREYEEFASALIAGLSFTAAHNAAEALSLAKTVSPDAILMDLRFDRTAEQELLGDKQAIAKRLFGGDATRALEYMRDQQGTLILAALREAGVSVPAVFVTDLPRRRARNLDRLYGPVRVVPSFDAKAIGAALRGGES